MDLLKFVTEAFLATPHLASPERHDAYNEIKAQLSPLVTTVDAIPVADILSEIDHIKQNGIDLGKYGGQDLDEGRCRELCAGYLCDFINSEKMRRRIVQMDAASLPSPLAATRVALHDVTVEFDPRNNFCFKNGSKWVPVEDVQRLIAEAKQFAVSHIEPSSIEPTEAMIRAAIEAGPIKDNEISRITIRRMWIAMSATAAARSATRRTWVCHRYGEATQTPCDRCDCLQGSPASTSTQGENMDQELIFAALRELGDRIEKCGASIELTHAVTLCSDLRSAIGNKWNKPDQHAQQRVRDILPK